MSIVDQVEIQEFTYDAANVGFDAGGFDLVYEKGGTAKISKYAIKIQTADGSSGEYVGLWGGTSMALGQTLLLASRLPGRDAMQRELLFDEFKRALRQYDHMGHGIIDICLWDLAGKRLNASISQLLGGWRKKLPAYASTCHGDHSGGLSGPESYVDFAQACHDLGYKAFKMHGWYEGDTSNEAKTIRALGDAVGDRMNLMLDPACQLRTFADALHVGRACDDAGFFWYEDPFRDSGVSLHAHKILRERLKTPILATEHVRGIEPKLDFAIAGGTDFLRADPEYDMGITGVMKIAHLAEALGLDVEIHASGPAHRHCMSAIRNTNYYEVALVGPKMGNPLPPVYACSYSDELEGVASDGTFPVPEGPGLGVTYDWDYINHHTTKIHTFTRR